MSDLKFTIGIPTYNGASLIEATLKSILSQSFQNFEIVISDDASTDNTLEVVQRMSDGRIQIFKNETNLGYGGNLQELRKHVTGDIFFLMGQDDILLKDALLKTARAFTGDEEVGIVTRPYYWFHGENTYKPVRAVTPYDFKADRVLTVFDGRRAVQKLFEAAGQLSGLAYRMRYWQVGFHDDVFPSHIYPLADIAKRQKFVFLKGYTVAVRIVSSQTRFKPSIYEVSPAESWARMFQTIFPGERFRAVRRWGIDQVGSDVVGLVQIKNYSTFSNLVREIGILIRLRPLNLISPRFWLLVSGIVLVPRGWFVRLVDFYKETVLSRFLRSRVPIDV